jgi:hypothetical protein
MSPGVSEGDFQFFDTIAKKPFLIPSFILISSIAILFLNVFGRHTGLGLFLSREILSIKGITITGNGEPGKGARFEITVPDGAYRFTGGKVPGPS